MINDTGQPAEGTLDVPPAKTVQAAVYIGYLLVLVVLFVGAAELILRAKGIKPWQAESAAVSSIGIEPGGKFFEKHPTLGYTHIPGKFVVTLGAGEQHLRFRVTHLPNTLRITKPLESYSTSDPGESGKEDIWIFGCSYTHGWSVNDEESYPWLLQEQFPAYNVVNYGVSGYGTVHSLIQFRESLKTRTPKVAVLAYADFHDERNTFSRSRRKSVAPWNRLGPLVQPYARLDKDGRLQFFEADVEYPEFPLMRRLALSHFLETTYDQLETKRLRSHEVSQALVLEMAALAKQHDVKFLVVNISGTPPLQLPAGSGVPVVDISVDGTRPENNNKPFDSHPSALAQAQFARTLTPLIAAALAPAN